MDKLRGLTEKFEMAITLSTKTKGRFTSYFDLAAKTIADAVGSPLLSVAGGAVKGRPLTGYRLIQLQDAQVVLMYNWKKDSDRTGGFTDITSIFVGNNITKVWGTQTKVIVDGHGQWISKEMVKNMTSLKDLIPHIQSAIKLVPKLPETQLKIKELLSKVKKWDQFQKIAESKGFAYYNADHKDTFNLLKDNSINIDTFVKAGVKPFVLYNKKTNDYILFSNNGGGYYKSGAKFICESSSYPMMVYWAINDLYTRLAFEILFPGQKLDLPERTVYRT